MNNDIEVKESVSEAPVEVHVREATPQGYIAFVRPNSTGTYFQWVTGFEPNELRDYHRHPYPLFESKEKAMEAVKHYLRGNGGEARIVKVTL